MTDLLYQHSDNVISVPIVDDVTGEAIPASSFSDAEYTLFDYKREVKVAVKLGHGISISGGNFEVRLEDSIMTDQFLGAHYHQFVVWNQSGDKLPPVFSRPVKVNVVVKKPEI